MLHPGIESHCSFSTGLVPQFPWRAYEDSRQALRSGPVASARILRIPFSFAKAVFGELVLHQYQPPSPVHQQAKVRRGLVGTPRTSRFPKQGRGMQRTVLILGILQLDSSQRVDLRINMEFEEGDEQRPALCRFAKRKERVGAVDP